MRKLQTLTNRLKKFQANEYREIALRVLQDNEGYLLALNREQLNQGLNPQGQLIGTYSRNTEFIAANKSPSPRLPKVFGQPYNFEDTGELVDNLVIAFGKRRAVFSSTDTKTQELLSRFGNLFGLTQDNFRKAIVEKIYPEYQKELCKYLGLR